MGVAISVVLAYIVVAMGLSWVYFRRFTIKRPPLGVPNLWDMGFMLGAIVLVPYLYLALATWFVAGLLGLGLLGAIYFILEPVMRARLAVWPIILLAALDVGGVLWFGPQSAEFFAVNNVVLILGIVAVANLWAQSGAKARDVTVLGIVLMVYDALSTSVLTLMKDLVTRVMDLPFAPLVAWPIGSRLQVPAGGRLYLAIGFGDLVLAALFPLVMRKAFGRTAGIVAMLVGLIPIALLLAVATPDDQRIFPAMVVLGPLMLAQYLFWHRRRGVERTTWQYLQAEPMSSAGRAR